MGRGCPTLSKTLSLRLPQEVYSDFNELHDGAGLTTAEGMRRLMEASNAAAAALNLDGLTISCEFFWRREGRDYFAPEQVGGLQVRVSPPAGLTQEDLARLVFVIPEFHEVRIREGDSRVIEPLRVDSFYFHRVSSARIGIGSTKVHRNVLSLRLIQGVWRAGIFRYDESLSVADMERRIKSAVERHFRATIACSLLGRLPDDRVQTVEELAHADEIVVPYMLADGDRVLASERG